LKKKSKKKISKKKEKKPILNEGYSQVEGEKIETIKLK
jgi:hypothetical protein